MKNELLQEQTSREYGDACKKVSVNFIGDIFTGNNRADEPIFTKKDVQYDKYQLAKIVSFQQLEMLIRPFKNHPSYRRCVLGFRILFGLLLMMVLIGLSSIIVVQLATNEEESNFWIFVITVGLLATFLLFMIAGINILLAENKAKKELARYCQDLNLEHEKMTISAVQTQAVYNIFKHIKLIHQNPGKYTPFFSMFSGLQIKSYKVPDNEKSVKLYAKSQLFTGLSDKNSEPLLNPYGFTFDKEKMEKIISFEQLELLLRPYKANQAYKRLIFWSRGMLWSLLSILLMFIPIFISLNQTQIIITAILIGTIIYSILVFFICKQQKAQKQAIDGFVEFCRELNMRQTRIEIIAHMNEGSQSRLNNNGLYCLEIKEHGICIQ